MRRGEGLPAVESGYPSSSSTALPSSHSQRAETRVGTSLGAWTDQQWGPGTDYPLPAPHLIRRPALGGEVGLGGRIGYWAVNWVCGKTVRARKSPCDSGGRRGRRENSAVGPMERLDTENPSQYLQSAVHRGHFKHIGILIDFIFAKNPTSYPHFTDKLKYRKAQWLVKRHSQGRWQRQEGPLSGARTAHTGLYCPTALTLIQGASPCMQ